MLTIVLIYCLSTAPDQCVERHPVTDQFALPVPCLMTAQQIAASEQERMEAEYEHPGYRLTRTQCVAGHRERV